MSAPELWWIGLALSAGCEDRATRPPISHETDADTDADADSDTESYFDSGTTDGSVLSTVPQCLDVVPGPTFGTSTTATGAGTTSGAGTTTGAGTTAGGDTSDSGSPPPPPPPFRNLTLTAQFGINVTGCIDEVLLDGTVIDSTLNFTFGDQAWVDSGFDEGATGHYCTVSLSLANGTPAPAWMSSDLGLWYGIDHDGTNLVSDCGDETSFGPDVAGALMAYGVNGVGVGGALDPFVRDQFEAMGVDLTGMFGATLHLPLVAEDPHPNVSYAMAYEVDADQNLVVDGAGDLTSLDPTTLLNANGTVREGFYVVKSLTWYTYD